MQRSHPDDPELNESHPDDRERELRGDDDSALTARPSDRAARWLDDEGDRLVPSTNLGGAAPTPRGRDSGGDFPGPEDDLANLAEPEPPAAPEVDGLSVRPEEDIGRTMGREDPEP